MRRREFIAGLGSAAAWPLAARAQSSRVSRVGLAELAAENDRDGLVRVAAFRQSMEKLGWTLNRNLVIDYRWDVFDIDRARRAAEELLSLSPNVILCAATPATMAFKQATSTVPVVFVSVTEPVEQGIVQSLAHPGGNLTGFTYMQPSIGAKWLDLLKKIAPHVTNVALMFNPGSSPYSRLFYQSIESVTSIFAVQAAMAPIHDLTDVENLMTALAAQPGGGLIVSPEGYNLVNRKAIIELAARHRLPTIYGIPGAALDGGLVHYCVDLVEQYRSAAGYVDKIWQLSA